MKVMARELREIAALIDRLNDNPDSEMFFDITVRDLNREKVGYIGWTAENESYIFSANKGDLK